MALLAVVASVFALGAGSANAADPQVRICHAGNSNSNPYQNNPPADGSKIVSGHASHTGPVWNPTLKAAGIQWGDIIPPFNYTDSNGNPATYPGLNWTPEGQIVWGNGCAPVSATAVTPTVTPSACSGGVATLPSYTVPTTTGVIYKVGGVVVTGVRTGVSSTETLTAVAAPGYVLTNAPFSVVMTFGALATGCGLPTNATAVAPDPVTPSSCTGGVVTHSSYVVPTTTGVIYKVNGGAVTSGSTRFGTAPTTETLTADAEPGFILTNAGFSVIVTFLADAAGCTPATAVAPTIVPSSCTNGVVAESSYVVPTTTGVIYQVGGVTVASGTTLTGTAPTVQTLTAIADTGYALTNPNFSATMTFTALAAGCTPATAVTPTVTASTCAGGAPTTPSYTVPTTTGVIYQVGGVTVTGVRTGVSKTETLTAIAAPNYVLTAPFSQVMTFGALATGCAPPPPPPAATSPDLGIVKAGPANAVKPGADVPYTLTVTNTGNGSATNVTVNDVLPAAMTLVSATGNGFTCTGTTSISCVLGGSLAPGASAVVNVVATLAGDYPSTAVANTATVLPTDANPANNTSTATTPVTLPTPPVDQDLGLSKTGLEPSVAPGGVLSWSLTVTNVKGTPAAGFTVTDVVPDGLTVLTVGGTDWSCSTAGQTVKCTYTGAPLATGGTSAFQLDALVGADYTGTTVSNTAVVDPGGVDTTNDSATSVTPVTKVITGGGGGGVTEPSASPSPSPTPSAGGGGGPALPFTGSYTDRALSTGVLLLMLGLFLAIAGRRRRSQG